MGADVVRIKVLIVLAYEVTCGSKLCLYCFGCDGVEFTVDKDNVDGGVYVCSGIREHSTGNAGLGMNGSQQVIPRTIHRDRFVALVTLLESEYNGDRVCVGKIRIGVLYL